MAQILMITITALALLSITTAKIPDWELDAALSALQSQGYILFPNAIATSDIRSHLLSSPNSSKFTLFSPPDSFLYTLDFSASAAFYIRALLRHVSPSRLSLLHLRNGAVSSSSNNTHFYIDSLLPRQPLQIDHSRVMINGTVSESVLVEGVCISWPDIFLGESIAVHGLEGIIIRKERARDIWAAPGIWSSVGHRRFAKFNHEESPEVLS